MELQQTHEPGFKTTMEHRRSQLISSIDSQKDLTLMQEKLNKNLTSLLGRRTSRPSQFLRTLADLQNK